MAVSRPETLSIARDTATAARGVIARASSTDAGASRTLIYSPPSGEAKARAMRPRPALWLPAMRTLPARAEASPRRAALVEPAESV